MKLISTKKAHAMIMDLPYSCTYNINAFNTLWFTPTINALCDKLKRKVIPKQRITRAYYSPSTKCYCTMGFMAKKLFNCKFDQYSIDMLQLNLTESIASSNIPHSEAVKVYRCIAHINDNLPTDKYSIRDIIELMYWLANSMDNVAVNYRSLITLPALKQMIEGVKN